MYFLTYSKHGTPKWYLFSKSSFFECGLKRKEPPTGGIGGLELSNYEMGKGAVVGMEREVHCPYLPQRLYFNLPLLLLYPHSHT